MQPTEQIVTTVFCFGVPIGLVVVPAYFGMKSRLNFANYLKTLSEAERKQLAYRSSTFIAVSWSIFALGFASILAAILFEYNQIVPFLFAGTVPLIITIGIIGYLTVYKIPKNKL